MCTIVEQLATTLFAALEDPVNRLLKIQSFQEIVWASEEPLGEERVDLILSDLADALDFYEPNPEWRRESPSYYGDDRFEEYVRSALKQLADKGVHPKNKLPS
jgi:hypothetical protein